MNDGNRISSPWPEPQPLSGDARNALLSLHDCGVIRVVTAQGSDRFLELYEHNLISVREAGPIDFNVRLTPKGARLAATIAAGRR